MYDTDSINSYRYFPLFFQSGEDDDELVDSDGEVLGFENLVHAIFEIVHILMESPK